MAVYMIFKYGKQFHFAPSFNYSCFLKIQKNCEYAIASSEYTTKLEKISPHCVLVQLKFAPVTLTIDPFLVVISRFFSFVDFGGLLLIF